MNEKGRNIVLFSDGTGNSAGKAQKTNVWRLFQAIDQTTPAQVAKYDDGVGTSSNKYLAAIGGAFGWGLKRNVLDLYKFACRNYALGDRLYGFGFSRGAFTIRVLVDLIATEGLVTFGSEEELSRNAAAAYRHYRAKKFPSRSPIVVAMRWLRDALFWLKDRVKGYRDYERFADERSPVVLAMRLVRDVLLGRKGGRKGGAEIPTVAGETSAAGRQIVPFRFLGLWDTVEAYGMPIEELKRGIDWVLWPMLFGDFILSPRVERACHALSLDDERTTFHPLPWDEVAEARMVADGEVKPGRITQVWFAGVHSNVGGGYPEDQLSLIPLDWMMVEARRNGLEIMAEAFAQVAREKSAYARLYDSREGVAAFYRYAPREIRVRSDGQGTRILPIVHGSVILRMAHGSDDYAPITLPHEFWVLAPDGSLLPMEGAPLSLVRDQAKGAAGGEPGAATLTPEVQAEKAALEAAILALERPDREALRLVWDTVFWRRCLYFLTVTLAAVLVAYPLLGNLAFSDGLEQGARGAVARVLEALGGPLPAMASPWLDAVKERPLAFIVLVASIVGCLFGSSILEGRIHDRARFAWHGKCRERYAKWCAESQKGWRNALIVATALSGGASIAGPSSMRSGFALLTAVLIALLVVRALRKRPAEEGSATAIAGTFALSLGRWLRYNRFLTVAYDWLFHRTAPILFALLLLALGWGLANRAAFDIASTAGMFCRGEVADGGTSGEKLGESTKAFDNRESCWPSGLVLTKGGRYRLTLTTPGDWFDASGRADVIGFPGGSLTFYLATPLKRWWRENWFRPVARIGSVGNDEYALHPITPIAWTPYPPCAEVERPKAGARISDELASQLMQCAPTPADRRVLQAEITARSSGELFLYVNDAVVLLPGARESFYRNNRGTALVKAERLGESSSPK